MVILANCDEHLKLFLWATFACCHSVSHAENNLQKKPFYIDHHPLTSSVETGCQLVAFQQVAHREPESGGTIQQLLGEGYSQKRRKRLIF